MGLELTTDRYPPITSQTRYPLRHTASRVTLTRKIDRQVDPYIPPSKLCKRYKTRDKFTHSNFASRGICVDCLYSVTLLSTHLKYIPLSASHFLGTFVLILCFLKYSTV